MIRSISSRLRFPGPSGLGSSQQSSSLPPHDGCDPAGHKPGLGFRNRAQIISYAARAVYHSFAAVLDGEDMEWQSVQGKVLRLSMLVFTLVSYPGPTATD